MIHPDVQAYNTGQTPKEQPICTLLAEVVDRCLPGATNKLWHAHPVWFLADNPIAGYSKLKGGIRLMFWSGADFAEEDLKPGTGKFRDASILYTDVRQVNETDLMRWLEKSKAIQWDYKNIVKKKGQLDRLV